MTLKTFCAYAEAARAEKLFLRFRADESAQAITARPRLLKPEYNNERPPIHEHETGPLRPSPAARGCGRASRP